MVWSDQERHRLENSARAYLRYNEVQILHTPFLLLVDVLKFNLTSCLESRLDRDFQYSLLNPGLTSLLVKFLALNLELLGCPFEKLLER